VETWGLLVGRDKSRAAALNLLTWLNLPDTVMIIPPHKASIDDTHRIIQGLTIDCVDVMLAELATSITECCGFNDPCQIATFDTGDFTRMFKETGLKFRILDMKTFEIVDMRTT
jgi:hypothetical protein